MKQPLVAVSTDIRHFEKYTWHATPDQYLEAAISVAGVLPVLVPSFGERLDIDGLLSRVDGVMLTGSKTNVNPALYGKETDERNGPYDDRRDATTLPLIRRAIERGVPLLAICRGIQELNVALGGSLAICRGIQELNVALGGSLATEIQEIEGRMDHRAPPSEDQDERFAIHQTVRIEAGSCLAGIFGAGEIMVNSVHRQGIGTLAPRLAVEAVAGDGTVEAVSVVDAPGFAIGVQWHPEYWAGSDDASARIFRAFGDATRRYADASRLRAAE